MGTKPAVEGKPVRLFILEDNDMEFELFKTVIKDWSVPYDIKRVCDGEDAILVLHDGIENNYIPDLIILDFNVPKMNGLEVLKIIKSHDNLKLVPVMMFSSSGSAQDILNCYEHHANIFIQKPHDLDTMKMVLKTVEQFFFVVSHLPDGLALKENY